MEYQDAIERIGRDDVTVTFGVAPPGEIVGPLRPRSVYYGQAFGYDERHGEFITQNPIPTVTFSFNKYRSDLPPWRQVHEFVLASRHEGDVVEVTFFESSLRGIDITGDLKTVTLNAEGPIEGVDCAIIERDEVAEKRGMGSDTQSFKVNEELF